MPAGVRGDGDVREVERRAATPLAGAIAGILFALLFTLSVSIMIATVVEVSRDTGEWLAGGVERVRFALGLVPFAGLFFLWFIAVARERLGRLEDQFFSTVFLGSGLLFLAMIERFFCRQIQGIKSIDFRCFRVGQFLYGLDVTLLRGIDLWHRRLVSFE